MENNAVIFTRPKVFGDEVIKTVVIEGTNLKNILENANPEIYRVYVNETMILSWDYKLKEGDLVNIMRVPSGGDSSSEGKQIAQVVAQIAVIGLSIVTGGLLTPVLGAIGANLVMAGMGIAGMYLLSMLFPPPALDVDDSKSRPTISGYGNQITTYKPVPKIYGTYRFAPPLAARPYTNWGVTDIQFVDIGKFGTYESKEYGQYLLGLICIGYLPLDVDGIVIGLDGGTDIKKLIVGVDKYNVAYAYKIDNSDTETDITSTFDFDKIRIGNTPINLFNSVVVEIGAMSEISLYKEVVKQENYTVDFPNYATHSNTNEKSGGGYKTDGDMTLFSTVLSWDSGGNETDLDWPEVDSVPSELYEVRTTYIDVDNAVVEIGFVAGLNQLAKEGETSKMGVEVAVYYAPQGTLLSNESAWVLGNRVTIIDNTRDPFQFSIPIEFDPDDDDVREPGQYEVLVYRIGTWTQSNTLSWYKIYTDFKWIYMRSYLNEVPPVATDDFLLMAYRILATDQLSGTIDDLNIEVSGYVRKIESNLTFSYTTDANPAWAFLDVLTGNANKNPIDDSKLDLQKLYDWSDWCETNGIEYNWVELNQETVLSRLRAIATTGFASWNIIEGKFGVVRDIASQTPVQMITPRNSWGFSSSKSFGLLPHGFKVKYIDENKWEESSVTAYLDEYNFDGSDGKEKATNVEEMTTRGVITEAQAYRAGRYFLASLKLRPEVFTVNMDVENIVATRGDVVLINHDVLLVGLDRGRIKSVTDDGGGLVTIVSDEELENDGLATYGVAVRTQENEILTSTVTIASGTGVVSFQAALDYSKLNVGDLFVFGESGLETIRAKVTNIEYHNDLSATLNMVDEAPAILNAHTDPIPDYDPGITEPVDLSKITPPVPRIISISSDSSTLYRGIDGTFKPSVVVVYGLDSSRVPVGAVEIRYANVAGGLNYKYIKYPTDVNFIRLTDVFPNETITVQLRSISIYNKPSSWCTAQNVTVIGKEYPPSDVEDFNVFVANNKVKATWSQIADVDRDSYEIRYISGHGTFNWSEATFLWRGKVNEADLGQMNSGDYTFGIKAIDTSDIYSDNASTFQASLSIPVIGGLSATFEKANLRLSWNLISTDFKVDQYKIYIGDTSTFGSATLYDTVEGTMYLTQILPAWEGTKYWFVQPVDDYGNVGDEEYVSVEIVAPEINTIASTVIDNNVLLQWTTIVGTLEVAYYKILIGDTYGTAEEIGSSNSTYTNIFALTGGEKTYWIVPYDVAGIEGIYKSRLVEVTEPPDFQLLDDYTSNFDGTGVTQTSKNLEIFTNKWFRSYSSSTNNILVFGSYLEEDYSSFGAVFSGESWTNIQAKITAGYPEYLTPSDTGEDCWYQEQIDYGGTIDAATITFEFDHSLAKGSGGYTVTPEIQVSANGSDWDVYTDVTSIFVTDFRYVRYKLSMTLTDDNQLIEVTKFKARLAVKIKTISGVVETTDQTLDSTKEYVAGYLFPNTAGGSTGVYMQEAWASGKSWDKGGDSAITIEWIGTVMTDHPNSAYYMVGHYASYHLGITDGSDDRHKKIYFALQDDTSTYHIASSTLEFPVGKKVHLAVSWNNTNGDFEFYIDGQPAGSASNAGSVGDGIKSSTLAFMLGRKNTTAGGGNATDLMYIQTNEIRIWDDVRTDQEIEDNYADALVGTEGGLNTYWRFDDETDIQAINIVGTNNETLTDTVVTSGQVWVGAWVDLASHDILDVISVTGNLIDLEPDNILLIDFKDIPSPQGFFGIVYDQATPSETHGGFSWIVRAY